jgi:hypothetical protein
VLPHANSGKQSPVPQSAADPSVPGSGKKPRVDARGGATPKESPGDGAAPSEQPVDGAAGVANGQGSPDQGGGNAGGDPPGQLKH